MSCLITVECSGEHASYYLLVVCLICGVADVHAHAATEVPNTFVRMEVFDNVVPQCLGLTVAEAVVGIHVADLMIGQRCGLMRAASIFARNVDHP